MAFAIKSLFTFFHYLFSKDIKNGLKQFFGPKTAYFHGRKKLNGTQDLPPPLMGKVLKHFPSSSLIPKKEKKNRSTTVSVSV